MNVLVHDKKKIKFIQKKKRGQTVSHFEKKGKRKELFCYQFG